MFAVWGLTLGTLYTIINPPFAVNDERSHLLRVHELTTGRLVTRVDESGAYHMVPTDYQPLIRRYALVQRKWDDRINLKSLGHDLVTAENPPTEMRIDGRAATYAPIAYIPHLPAVGIARLLRLPVIWQVYFARLASVVCFVLLAGWAIALSGDLKWLFFTLGLMPMSVTQAAGLSGDGVTNGMAFLFFAILGRAALFGDAPPSRRELIALFLLPGLLACCKPAYLLVALALPALPWAGERAGLRRWIFSGLTLLGCGLLLASWGYLNRKIPVESSGFSPPAQIAWILANPLGTVEVAFATVFTQVDDLMIQFVAVRDLLSREIRFIGGAVGALYLQLLLLIAWGAAWSRHVAPKDRWARVIWPLFASLACTGAVFLAMYLGFTTTGSGTVRGVQGRYLIPLAPGFLMPFTICGRPTLSRWLTQGKARRLLVPIIVLNLVCLFALIGRYYAPVTTGWPL